MENIVTEMLKVIKENDKPIEQEQALIRLFVRLFCECLAQAFKQIDDELMVSYQQEGYIVERKDHRTIQFLFGAVTFFRRRMSKPKQKGFYPLDKEMGFIKHQRYSSLVLKNVSELATKGVYRQVARAVELLTPLSMSHQKVNQLVIKVGEYCDTYEVCQETVELPVPEKKQVPFLYLEGDGIILKGKKKKKLEIHRFQVAEGVEEINGRRQLVAPHYFTGLSRKGVIQRMVNYLDTHYSLRETTLLSNSDGGSGYESHVFEEMAQGCLAHEHFRDSYHVNRKIKERLRFAKFLQYPLIDAITSYDYEKLTLYLDTAEALEIEGQQEAHDEHVRLLRQYLERNWTYLKPVSMRELTTTVKGLGTCESNHRQYTYRMKRQGRYWTKKGAESMVKVIDAVRNDELSTVLNQVNSHLTKPVSAPLKNAVRQALKKTTHRPHSGAIQGRIYTNGTRTSGMSKLAQGLAN